MTFGIEVLSTPDEQTASDTERACLMRIIVLLNLDTLCACLTPIILLYPELTKYFHVHQFKTLCDLLLV